MNEGPQPDRVDRRLLAAYADGELDPAARQRLLEGLENDPDALAELLDQENLSPSNLEYWEQVAPSMPTEQQWRDTLTSIAAAVPTPAAPGRFKLASLGVPFVGAAAAVLLVVAGWQLKPTGQRPVRPDVRTEVAEGPVFAIDEDEDLIFRVATDDDVTLIELPESAVSAVVVGRHPIEDSPLLLAAAGDVQLLNYSTDEPTGWPSVENSQGSEASVLWAPGRP